MNDINAMKLRILMEVEQDHIIDPEEDFFDLGMLKMHGLIDDDLNLTPAGEKVYLEMIKENNNKSDI